MNPLIGSLFAFIAAFPKFISLLTRFADWVGKRDLNAWLDQVEGGINQLEKARTPQEKLDAAKTLVDAIRKLHTSL